MKSNSTTSLLPPLAAGILVLFWCSEYGCTSSQLTTTWVDPAFKGQPMTAILVIAVKKNPVVRRIWEDGLVSALSSHHVTCTPSYSLVPNTIPDSQQVAAAIRENTFDGILVVRRLPTETATYDRPGYVHTVPVTRYDRLSKTYSTFYREVYEPGYSDTLKIMRHEIDLWSSKAQGQLVWAGTGETMDPSSRGAVRTEVTELIVPELARQGIIPAE